jgi:hypothetical protein
MHPTRSRAALASAGPAGAAVVLAVALALTACSTSGSDSGARATTTTTRAGATTTASTAATTTTAAPTTTTTTAPTTTTTSPIAARWVGVRWEAASGGGPPLVDGQPIDLTSTTGLCREGSCQRALELLTGAPTGGAPAPGPYVLWASELVDRTADGRPVWTITDAQEVELAPGSAIYACHPSRQPMVQVLGFGPTDVDPQAAEVIPTAVWDVDDHGNIQTPAPGGYACEVGQD